MQKPSDDNAGGKRDSGNLCRLRVLHQRVDKCKVLQRKGDIIGSPRHVLSLTIDVTWISGHPDNRLEKGNRTERISTGFRIADLFASSLSPR